MNHKSDDARGIGRERPCFECSRGGRPDQPATQHSNATGDDHAGANFRPNTSPPATTTQTTGESSQDPTVKKMNEDEKQKVDTKGK